MSSIRKNIQTKRISSGSYAHKRPSFSSSPRRSKFKKNRIDERLFVHKAVVVNEELYTPVHNFSDFAVHEQIKKNITAKGYTQPSPIQDAAIPVILTGKDVIGIAGTGTGKTAAFLIPLINKLTIDRMHQILILAPTRELALQIEKEFVSFTKGMSMYSVCCVGGSPIMRQIRELDQGVHIVIGTPGRVTDLIDRKKIKIGDFGTIVLDEADRMLDMGFIDDMRYILKLMPKNRQSLFFSATFSNEIKALCKDFLNNPETISVKTSDTAGSVEQNIVRARSHAEKLEVLHDILNKPECSKVLIFCEMKRSVDQLQVELKKRGFKALALHGDMHNREREKAVKDLTSGLAHVVIATDVAARGIDILDISHVINFDIPSTYDTYIHRVGRTGRGNKLGTALTFV